MYLSLRDIIKYLLLLHICILSSAYFIEYVLNFKACPLCLYQRVPYFLSLTILLIVYINPKVNFNFFYILSLFSLINFSLATYQVGLENNIIQESLFCKSSIQSTDAKELLDQLNQKGLESCKNPNFKILGLSLAAINLFINIALIGFYVFIIKQWNKLKK